MHALGSYEEQDDDSVKRDGFGLFDRDFPRRCLDVDETASPEKLSQDP
ncbi:hypothetical protein JCM19235_4706 [Vibrio maritimus]|uniref:Uncharacterized protein n=1 Tax=Vibrio maritimus TaxID=990268 RepID=A0A090S7F7_9VIBR|nr:hypothetical protein JCM19235_4706 [Vibrio maritimus]